MQRKKGEEEQFATCKPRTFLSYCYEYCGKINVPFRSLTFKIGDSDLKFDQKVRGSCMVSVGVSESRFTPTTKCLLFPTRCSKSLS